MCTFLPGKASTIFLFRFNLSQKISTTMKSFLIVLSLWLVPALLFAQDRAVTKGMKISKTTKIKKAVYSIDGSNELTSSVITIEGNNMVIDFNNAVLKGSNKKNRPDEFFGVGIIIKNSKNVTIKNLKASGYKVALMASGC